MTLGELTAADLDRWLVIEADRPEGWITAGPIGTVQHGRTGTLIYMRDKGGGQRWPSDMPCTVTQEAPAFT